MANEIITFDSLAESIGKINGLAGSRAKGAVNQLMSIRNWLIGYYIVEYEQKGCDRAEYGDYVLDKLEERLGSPGLNKTLFKLSRQFYLTYPQIGATVSHQFNIPLLDKKSATVSLQFETKAETLISRLSFSHIREIMKIDDPFER